jgi:uncharacterized protein YjeT (DUF2065 family)
MVFNGETWVLAIALVLIFEGLFPMISPAAWRRMFEQILQLEDGQIRFFGLIAISLGLLMLVLVV